MGNVFPRLLNKKVKNCSKDIHAVRLRVRRRTACRLLAIFFVLFSANWLDAQYCTIYGYVKEKATNEPIVGAYIFISESNKGTTANTHGYYTLSVPCSKPIDLIFQSLGFQSDTINIDVSEDSLLNVELSIYSFTTIEVSAVQPGNDLGQKQLSVQKLENVPVLLGEPDPLKAISLLPGIASGMEGTVGLHVRGGSSDQNLFLLDGSTVYNNGHIFGFVSVFHPATIKNIDLYTGYFPSRYGGRLSSVFDFTVKDGNRNEVKREATLGLINSNLTVEGPFLKGRGAFLVSGRAAHSGLLSLATLPAYQKGEPWLFAGMYDFNGKMTYVFPNESKLSMSFYAGDDFWGSKVKEDAKTGNSLLTWGNRTLALRYTRAWAGNLFGETYLNLNHFKNNFQLSERSAITSDLRSTFNNRSFIEEWSIRQQFRWSYGRQAGLDFGGHLTAHKFQPVSVSINNGTEYTTRTSGNFTPISSSIYADHDLRLGRVKIYSGLRWSSYQLDDRTFQYFEPRFQLSYAFNRHLSGQIGYSRMIQYIHLVTTGGTGLPYDFWLPATASAPPQQAQIYSAGLQYSKSGMVVQIEAFYKQLTRQIDLPSGNSLLRGDTKYFWEESLLLNGSGKAYGLELLIEKNIGKLTGWAGYTWSRSFRQFEQINQDRRFPYAFDRPHDLELTLSYKLNDKWLISSNFLYQTGRPITIPEAIIRDMFGRIEIAYINRNNDRLPDYHRWDIQLSKSFKTKRQNRDATLNFGLYNAYGRPNTLYLDIGGEFLSVNNQFDRIRYNILNVSFFRFIPSINYTLKW